MRSPALFRRRPPTPTPLSVTPGLGVGFLLAAQAPSWLGSRFPERRWGWRRATAGRAAGSSRRLATGARLAGRAAASGWAGRSPLLSVVGLPAAQHVRPETSDPASLQLAAARPAQSRSVPPLAPEHPAAPADPNARDSDLGATTLGPAGEEAPSLHHGAAGTVSVGGLRLRDLARPPPGKGESAWRGTRVTASVLFLGTWRRGGRGRGGSETREDHHPICTFAATPTLLEQTSTLSHPASRRTRCSGGSGGGGGVYCPPPHVHGATWMEQVWAAHCVHEIALAPFSLRILLGTISDLPII